MNDMTFIENGRLVHMQSPEKCTEDLLKWVEHYKAGYEKLKSELKELREEYDKDEEVAQLKAELAECKEDLLRGFPITEKEYAEIHEWYKKHAEEKHGGKLHAGAIGGEMTYSFVPTGIGTLGTITCMCGESYTFQPLL